MEHELLTNKCEDFIESASLEQLRLLLFDLLYYCSSNYELEEFIVNEYNL